MTNEMYLVTLSSLYQSYSGIKLKKYWTYYFSNILNENIVLMVSVYSSVCNQNNSIARFIWLVFWQ